VAQSQVGQLICLGEMLSMSHHGSMTRAAPDDSIVESDLLQMTDRLWPAAAYTRHRGSRLHRLIARPSGLSTVNLGVA
jgi:hypothetical protein